MSTNMRTGQWLTSTDTYNQQGEWVNMGETISLPCLLPTSLTSQGCRNPGQAWLPVLVGLTTKAGAVLFLASIVSPVVTGWAGLESRVEEKNASGTFTRPRVRGVGSPGYCQQRHLDTSTDLSDTCGDNHAGSALPPHR